MSPELQIGIQIGLAALVGLMGLVTWLGKMEVARLVASITELQSQVTEINKELQILRIETSARDRSNTFFEGAVRDIAADVKKLFERLPQLESRMTIIERERKP